MARYLFSGYEIDVDSREIRRNGHRVPVQPQPFLILVRLLETPGEVVGRAALIRLLWGETSLANPDHSLNIAVRKLRDALDDAHDQPRFIETVARVGYRFIGRLEVERVAEEVLPVVVPPAAPKFPTRRWALAGIGAAFVLGAGWRWLPLPDWIRRGAAAQAPEPTELQLVWDQAVSVGGRVSADGRYFPYTDWKSADVGIGVRDLIAGVSRKLTRMRPSKETMAETYDSAVSPDGRFVAFGLHRYPPRQADRTSTLEVIDIDGERQRTVLRDAAIRYVKPLCWTPDGREIAARIVFHAAAMEGRDVLAMVEAETGAVRVFPTPKDEYPAHAFISPDGRWMAYSTSPTPTTPSLFVRPMDDVERPAQRIQESAMLLGWSPDGQGIAFLRGREGGASLYFQPLLQDRAAGEPILLHPSLDAEVLPAGVTQQGALIYSTLNRRSEAIVLPAAELTNPAAEPQLSFPATVAVGWRLGPGTAHFSQGGNRIFVITPDRTLMIHEMPTGATRTIKPKLKSFRAARWAADESALLLLGVDESGRTGIFRVDDTTGKAALAIAVPEDTWSFTPSRDGRTLFFGTPLKTQAADLRTGATRTLLETDDGGNYDLRVSHDGGRLAIRSGVWLAVADLASGTTETIYRRPPDSQALLWAMEWSADDQELLTIARAGSGIERMELWSFPSRGGAPRKLAMPELLSGLSYSPDGRFVLTVRSTQRWQVWALRNFLPAVR